MAAGLAAWAVTARWWGIPWLPLLKVPEFPYYPLHFCLESLTGLSLAMWMIARAAASQPPSLLRTGAVGATIALMASALILSVPPDPWMRGLLWVFTACLVPFGVLWEILHPRRILRPRATDRDPARSASELNLAPAVVFFALLALVLAARHPIPQLEGPLGFAALWCWWAGSKTTAS